MFAEILAVALAIQIAQIPPRDAARPPGTGTGAIRGRVVAADTGAPIRRAVVTLMPARPDQGLPSRTVTTDVEGRFEFASLPAGTFRLRANPGPYRSQYLGSAYGGRRPNDMGRTIDLAAGQQIGGADIPMFRGGAVPGRVTDDFGDPVARAMVFAARVMPGSSSVQRIGASVQTDDQGRFRLFGLEPGDYVVAAETRNFGPPVEGESEGFATTYFPSSTNEREAARVRVSGSSDAADLEIQLVRTRTFRISGSVMNSKGQPVPNANVMLLRPSVGGGFSSGGMNRGADGKFMIRDVVPGEYRLVVRPMIGPPSPGEEANTKGPRPEYATVPLNVASDIDDLVVVTQPGVSIVGRVVFAEGTPATLPRIRVQAQPADRNSPVMGPSPNATSGADGQFTLNDLYGPLLLRGFPQGGAAGTMPGYTLKAVMLGGTDITDTPVEFKAEHSRHLEIVLTSRASTLEGTVTEESGAPAEDVMVLLIPEDKAAWRAGSPRLRMVPLQKEGRFSATRVLAGRYHAIAIPREGFSLSPDSSPEIFEQLVKDATSVVLNEDETRTIDLRVVRPSR
jgi:protocatechuate 3,4-dioxygenase beta subunit